MPFALITIGLIMIVTGVKGTQGMMAAQLRSDATGFITWVVAIGAIGALGYVEKLRTFSHYFMALVLIAMLLSNRGFFAELQKAISAGPERMPSDPCGTGGGSGSGTGKGTITISPGPSSSGFPPNTGSGGNILPDAMSDIDAGDVMKFLPYMFL
jgi:hypothetical protein